MAEIDITGVIPTRSLATKILYRKHFVTVQNHAIKALGHQPSMDAIIAWYVSNDFVWDPATIRSYNAGLRQVLIDLRLAGEINDSEQFRLYDLIAKGPQRRPAGKGEKRGPARKRKSLKDDEIDKLLAELKKSKKSEDKLLIFIIINSIRFFPRPGEWKYAYIDYDTKSLMFVNSKNSNGRGGVEDERPFDLKGLPEQHIALVQKFLDMLDAEAEKVGCWDTMIGRQKDRLRHLCERLGLKRIAFYTFRHVGMATAKSLYSRKEVAFLSGHIATRTAGSHYPPQSAGLKGPLKELVGSTLVDQSKLEGIRENDNAGKTAEDILDPTAKGRTTKLKN